MGDAPSGGFWVDIAVAGAAVGVRIGFSVGPAVAAGVASAGEQAVRRKLSTQSLMKLFISDPLVNRCLKEGRAIAQSLAPSLS